MDKQTKRKLKAQIIESGLCKEVSKASRHNFVNGDRKPLSDLECLYGVSIIKEARAINQASYKRKQRVSHKIGSCIEAGQTLFLTLTFKDDVLAKTNEKTRRRYVTRFLKASSRVYVANIDYGGEKGREHYHALILGADIDYSPWHKYGAIKGEKVRTTDADREKVCKYVSKLSNHAMKVNDGLAPRLIYSRGSKSFVSFLLDPPF